MSGDGGSRPGSDLSEEPLRAALGDRPLRVYPAILSTHADALAWARAGCSSGAVVVADYQASPRGRAGLEWRVRPGRDLGFSIVVRPELDVRREGWTYLAATGGVAHALDDPDAEVSMRWPDEIWAGGRRRGAVGVHTELGAAGVDWAVVTVLVEDAGPPRAPLLAEVVGAIEAQLAAAAEEVLQRWREDCSTLGTRVRARMIPMGPSGTVIEGTAVDVKDDGALLVEPRPGVRIGVLPHHLGVLEAADAGG